METFDIVILLISAIALILGFATGLVMQLAILAGVVLGTVFSGQLAALVSPKLIEWTSGSPHIIMPVSYAIAFIIIFILVILAGRLLQSLFEAVKINVVNRLVGAAFSFTAWIVLVSVVINVVVEIDKSRNIITDEIRDKSITYPYVKEAAAIVAPYLRFDQGKS